MTETENNTKERSIAAGIAATVGTVALLAGGAIGLTKIEESRNGPVAPNHPASFNKRFDGQNPANIIRSDSDK